MLTPSTCIKRVAASPQHASNTFKATFSLLHRAIFAALLLLLLPTLAMAAEVTLAWDPNDPTPDGYRVYMRMEGGVYDFDTPTWPTDGQNHTETMCTIQGLTEGSTYYFVVRAFVGTTESDNSNEASYTVPTTQQPVSHNINASSGANGSIAPNGTISVDDNGSQTFTITPTAGYVIADVLVDGQSVGTPSSHTFSNVTRDRSISATFTPQSYTISVSAGANGRINPSGIIGVSHGDTRNFTVSANSGYQIQEVIIDGQSAGTGASHTLSNITQNHTISASFVEIPVANQSPIAEAGSTQTRTSGDNVTLNGSGSRDPDGGALSYSWQLSGNGTPVTLTGATMAQCSFTAPDVTQTTSLTFELTVTDPDGAFDKDTCIVVVNPAQSDPEPDPEPDNDNDGIPDDQDPDDDNDLMPDTWENTHGLDPMNNDAGNDPDGDQATNYEEYLAGTDPNTAEGNRAPSAPGITTPSNGATGQSLTLQLRASAFDDPDAGDDHQQSQWQILVGGDTILDRMITNGNLTRLKVPRVVLNPSTRYTVRVRYYDNHGETSSWSTSISFTTGADGNDPNGNRIPDAQEVSEHTDMNGDGTADFEQPDTIKSMTTYDDLYLVGVSIEGSGNATTVECAADMDPMSMETTPTTERERPYGLLGYKIRVTRGATIEAVIHLSDPIDTNDLHWVRYDNINGWSDCSATTTIDADGFVVTRTLQDGGQEDADGVENGIIVDISGPEAAMSNTSDGSNLAVANDSGSASGGSGGGGCFIGSIFGNN